MKEIILYALIALTLTGSCTAKDHEEGVRYFNRSDFKDSTQVVLDTISLPHDLLDPVAFYVLRDSILLARTSQNSEYLVEIYNLNTQQLITKTAHLGRGPYEVLSGFVLYRSEQDKFIVFDMISRKFQIYHVDSLLALKENYRPQIQNAPTDAVDIALVDSNKFAFYDSRYLESKKYSNEVPEIEIENLNPQASYTAGEFKYFAGQVNGGRIFVKPDYSKIIVCSINTDRINIYNRQLELQTTLIGPDNLQPEYSTQINSWGTNIIKCKNCTATYSLGFTTNDFLYTIYWGHSDFKQYTEIFKFNWDGECIDRYIVNYYISTLSISNGYIYATGYEVPRSMPKLVRFKI